MDHAYVSVECILDEGTKSTHVKLPGQLRVGEATKLLIERFKSGDPEASHYGLVVQREVGGAIVPSDPSKTLISLLKHTSKVLVFRKITRTPMTSSTSTLGMRKKGPGNFSVGLFGVLSPDFATIDPFVQKEETSQSNDIPFEYLLRTIHHLEQRIDSVDDVNTLSRNENFQEEIDQFKIIHRTGKWVDLSLPSRSARQLLGMTLYLVKEVFPEGLVPKAFLAALNEKAVEHEVLFNLVSNLQPNNKFVLRRLVMLLLNIKKKGLDAEKLLKKIATCINSFVPRNVGSGGSTINITEMSSTGTEERVSRTRNNNNVSSSNVFAVDDYSSTAHLGGSSGSDRASVMVVDDLGAMYTAECELIIRALMTNFMRVFAEGTNLLQGESVLMILESVYCLDRSAQFPLQNLWQGELWITDYRLIYNCANPVEDTTIPMMTILQLKPLDTVRTSNMTFYEVTCKDFRWKLLGFNNSAAACEIFKNFLDNHWMKPPFHKFMLAFSNVVTKPKENDNTVYIPSLQSDFEHMKMSKNTKWRGVSNVIHNSPICPTYPASVYVPVNITDITLKESADYRAKRRYPVLSWASPCSHAVLCRAGTFGSGGGGAGVAQGQGPSTVSLGSLAIGDDVLVSAIANTNSNFPILNVIETGSFSPAANFYPSCKFHFNVTVPGPAEMRDNFEKLLSVHKHPPDRGLPSVALCEPWLDSLRKVCETSISVVQRIETGESVMIQHGDTCDVDATIACMAQLQLDPYYRTIEGFMTLIEKEWICMGHPFGLRSCHEFINKKTDAETFAPFFAQFMHAVWLLWQQSCRSFQFNEDLLLFLLDELYSCRFGTFLYNSELLRRTAEGSWSRTPTVWGYIRDHMIDFLNPHYEVVVRSNSQYILNGVVKLDLDKVGITMWNEYFFRFWRKDRETKYKVTFKIREGPTQLTLVNHQTLSMPDQIFTLTNLQSLDMSRNALNYITPKFSVYCNLKKTESVR